MSKEYIRQAILLTRTCASLFISKANLRIFMSFITYPFYKICCNALQATEMVMLTFDLEEKRICSTFVQTFHFLWIGHELALLNERRRWSSQRFNHQTSLLELF
ncbi:hypothetical protein RF11_04459 [Thelohanellus kitauei]|uniref:Uncharacterized protein n=1 Tax=Thelohanellus kitauei TaxID=669202 RepID=A0A0C2IV73_THEKT|nr:hypothetical protein RF11_04459 [Thelohanellus kitauei]